MRSGQVDGESELVERYRGGDRAAGSELVSRMERWLRAEVRRYRRMGLDRDDVRQEGRIALLKAAASYDPAKGAFRPYASKVVRREVVRAACGTGTVVILPARFYAESLLHLRAGEPLPEDLAAAMRLRFASSAGTAVLNGPDPEALGDALVHAGPSPEAGLAEREQDEHIKDAIYRVLLGMPAVQCAAVARRRLKEEPPTIVDAAASMSMSPNAFCHLDKLALARLRRELPALFGADEMVGRAGARRKAKQTAMAAE